MRLARPDGLTYEGTLSDYRGRRVLDWWECCQDTRPAGPDWAPDPDRVVVLEGGVTLAHVRRSHLRRTADVQGMRHG